MHLRWMVPAFFGAFLAPDSHAEERTPRLVVLLTVDQGRGDYLERFRPALEGGFARLLEEGVVFTDAHHFHAGTVTAAGHASLSTGRYPGHSGMVGNNWYDRIEGRHVYCVEDRQSPILPPEGAKGPSGNGRSPSRLLATGLGDWIKASSPTSKVYSIGAKDRSAVIMGGKNAEASFWYDATTGQWVTSVHYTEEYPAWAVEKQRARLLDTHFGEKWTPLPVSERLLAKMEVDVAVGEFSHALGRASLYPGRGFYNALFNSPFIESSLFDFAKTVVVEAALGADDVVDVLALSFASPDTVGHQYGPNSRELLDTILRLDRELGRFFDFLEEAVGLEHIAVSLSADHGVAPLPEFRSAKSLPGRRLSSDDYVCVQNAGRAFERRFGRDDWFVEPLHFDDATLERKGVERSVLEEMLARELAKCPSIERVWTRSQIEAAATGSWSDPILELYLHSFHPDRSPDLYVQKKEWHIDRGRGTTHGSPYTYDTHVIALVRWPGLEPRSVDERIHTVDLPVTLASLLGVAPPDDVDGVNRTDLMR